MVPLIYRGVTDLYFPNYISFYDLANIADPEALIFIGVFTVCQSKQLGTISAELAKE